MRLRFRSVAHQLLRVVGRYRSRGHCDYGIDLFRTIDQDRLRHRNRLRTTCRIGERRGPLAFGDGADVKGNTKIEVVAEQAADSLPDKAQTAFAAMLQAPVASSCSAALMLLSSGRWRARRA